VKCLRIFAAILVLPWHPSLAAREGFLPPGWPWLTSDWGTTDQRRTVTNSKETRPTRCSQDTTPQKPACGKVTGGKARSTK